MLVANACDQGQLDLDTASLLSLETNPMFGKLDRTMEKLSHLRRHGFGHDVTSVQGRRSALWHFYIFDHAFIRILWTNLFEIAPGVWRSNQPSPRRVARYSRMGIKTILNLRGTSNAGRYLMEEEACRKHNVNFVSITLSARHAAPKEQYLKLLEILESLEKPFLFHCKSGADRAGIVSAFYLLHVEKLPLSVARRQLSLQYAHIKWIKTGVLDHILDTYENDIERFGQMELVEWLSKHYDEEKIMQDFKPGFLNYISSRT
jgi:protein tyrosine phosphatase (PTP) superfamily phosphohydrolase (DUF442 family)